MNHRDWLRVVALTGWLLASGASLAPLAHAQGSLKPTLFPVNQPITFRYTDAQGAGSLILTDLGSENATGGDQVRVSILQNGVRYDGSGLIYPVAPPDLRRILVTFTVVSPWGGSYFFQGTLGSAAVYQGQGTYHPTLNPGAISAWSLRGGTGGGPGTGLSGIRGVALAGPITPGGQPGVPGTRPLPNAIITVQPAGGGAEIARAKSDATGRFVLPLAPGTYRVVPLPPEPGIPLPRPTPQIVVVPPGQYVDIMVFFDTRIQ